MIASLSRIATPASLRRVGRTLACVGLGLALGGPALADGYLDNDTPKEPTKPEWAVPAKRLPVEGEGVDASEAKLKNAEMRLREAQQNATTAEWAYTRARTRRYPRGDALMEIQQRAADMKKELADAEREFMDTVEAARRDGVPAGTLMPYMDIADQIRRDQAARQANGS